MQTEKIKIIKNTDSRVWYAKHIGETFDVVRTETTLEPYGRLLWVKEPNEFGSLNWVKEWDTEPVNE